MSGGYGSVLHAIKSLAFNKRKKKRILNNNLKEELAYEGNDPIVLKKASKEQLNALKLERKQLKRRERIRTIIATIVIIIVVISLILLIF